MSDDPQVTPAAEPPAPTQAPAQESAPAQPAAPTPEPSSATDSPVKLKDRGDFRDALRKVHEKNTPTSRFRIPRNAEAPAPSEPAPADASEGAPDTKPSTPSVPSAPGDSVESLLSAEPHGNMSEQGKIGWQQFKQKWAGIVSAKDNEIKRLTTLVAEHTGKSKGEVEALQKQIKELEAFRDVVDVHAKPEFQAKYIKPANALYSELSTLVKKINLEGAQVDWDNDVAVEEVALAMEKAVGAPQANVFRRKAAELRGIRTDYASEIANTRQNFDKIVQERSKQAELKAAEEDGIVQKTLTAIYEDKMEDGNPRFGFLVPQEAPPGADDATKRSIAEHNKLVQEHRKRIEGYAREKSPDGRAQIAALAELGWVLFHERPQLLKAIEEKEAELAKIQQSRSMRSNVAANPRPAENKGYKPGQSAAKAVGVALGLRRPE